jgi:hypothetical protein
MWSKREEMGCNRRKWKYGTRMEKEERVKWRREGEGGVGANGGLVEDEREG